MSIKTQDSELSKVLELLEQQQTEFDKLRSQLLLQEAEIARLKEEKHSTENNSNPLKQLREKDEQLQVHTSRRGLLKKMGVATAGIVALGALNPITSQAANNSPILIGQDNSLNAGSATVTSLSTPSSNTTLAPVLFRVDNKTGDAPVLPSFFRVGIFGSATAGSEGENYIRVGVYGRADRIGYGVYGVGDRVGVFGEGPQIGLYGVNDNENQGQGIGVFGAGGNGIGGYFVGKQAQLRLGSERDTQGPPSTPLHVMGEVYADSHGSLFYCVSGGDSNSPGTWRKITGSDVAGSIHLLNQPSRFVDTRISPDNINDGAGPYFDQTSRRYSMTLLQGRDGAGIPANARGILGNVTVTAATFTGNVQISPNGLGRLDPSTVNFTPGVDVANSFISQLNSNGEITVKANIGGGEGNYIHLIIDLIGYLM